MTESQLKSIIDSIASGDHVAFRIFYDYFYLRVCRFAHIFLSDITDCEIVVSDVFCIIWEKRMLLYDVSNIEAYLLKMTRNEAFNYIKKRKKINIVSLDDMPVELSVLSSQTEDKLIEDEMMTALKKAINTLPERCKLIFLLIREQKLSHKEVAEVLSISPGTVEVQMNIAIKKITKAISIHYPSLIKKRNKN